MTTHPVRFVVTDDLRRSRLTVLFRLPLALPHFLWATLWTYSMLVVIAFQWLWVIGAGRMEEDVHRYIGRLVRYHVHVNAYFFLLADPWPKPNGHEGYPVDMELDPPARQDRLTVVFRLILAVPAFVFMVVLLMVFRVIAFLGWFVSLALGRMPQGMRDLGAYCLRFEAQTYAYLLLLTPRYPSLAGSAPPASQSFARISSGSGNRCSRCFEKTTSPSATTSNCERCPSTAAASCPCCSRCVARLTARLS